MQRKKEDRGFTLTELLIVIVILGILTAVVVFAVRELTGDADSSPPDTLAENFTSWELKCPEDIEAAIRSNTAGLQSSPDISSIVSLGFCTVATSEFELVLESFPGGLLNLFVVGELSDGTTVILHFVIVDSDGDIRAEGSFTP